MSDRQNLSYKLLYSIMLVRLLGIRYIALQGADAFVIFLEDFS